MEKERSPAQKLQDADEALRKASEEKHEAALALVKSTAEDRLNEVIKDFEKKTEDKREALEKGIRDKLLIIAGLVIASIILAFLFVVTEAKGKIDDSTKEINGSVREVNGDVIELQKDIIAAQSIVTKSSVEIDRSRESLITERDRLKALREEYEARLEKLEQLERDLRAKIGNPASKG